MAEINSLGKFRWGVDEILPAVVVSVLNNDYDDIKYRLEKRRLNINKRIEISQYNIVTLLQIALMTQNEQMIDWLIEKGASLEDKYDPAILTAVRYCNKKIVKRLIELGGLDGLSEEQRSEILIQMGYGENYNILDILDSNGIVVSKYGGGLLRSLLLNREADYELVNKLIKMGVNINYFENNVSTPLIFAITYGHPKIANRLLDVGADVTIVDADGNRAYTKCVQNGFMDIAMRIKLLEPKDWHNIELKKEELYQLGCPQDMIDFLNGETLQLNFSEKSPVKSIEFFSLDDVIITKWKRKKIIRFHKRKLFDDVLEFVYMVSDKNIYAIDLDHETLYLLSDWKDFISNAESIIVEKIFNN